MENKVTIKKRGMDKPFELTLREAEELVYTLGGGRVGKPDELKYKHRKEDEP